MRRMRFVFCLATAGILAAAAVAVATPPERPLPTPPASPVPIPTNLLARVLSACDNRPAETTVTFTEDGKTWTFYVAAKNHRYAGVAFASSAWGYRSFIRVLVGVNTNEAVQGIEILDQRETRGIGTRVAEEAFRAQFVGKDAAQTSWATPARGGAIDAITGATISSDAVIAAVRAGLEVYQKHRDAIRRVIEPAGPATQAGAP